MENADALGNHARTYGQTAFSTGEAPLRVRVRMRRFYNRNIIAFIGRML